jgi:hypothetical protein
MEACDLKDGECILRLIRSLVGSGDGRLYDRI